MNIQVFDSYESLSRHAAEMIAAQLENKPETLFCPATGNSPLLTYAFLAEIHAQRPELFHKLKVLMLDEWYGLPYGHPASCLAYLQKNLTGPLEIDDKRFFRFNSDSDEAISECEKMQETLKSQGPVDLMVLGVGLNGHLGFNEPEQHLKPFTHIARLQQKTQNHSMVSSLSKAPDTGLTLGMHDILNARKIILIVNGPHKKEALSQLLDGQITTGFPASFLWMHPHVSYLIDRDALGNNQIPSDLLQK